MQDDVKKAIEILGAPVMDYAPDYSIKEYDAKIKKAVDLLICSLRRGK